MATLASSRPPPSVVLTYDDLQSTPDDGRRYEIADGILLVTPVPIIVHQHISGPNSWKGRRTSS
jgi:hypothetical protein